MAGLAYASILQTDFLALAGVPPVAVQASRGRRRATVAAAQETQLAGLIAATPAAYATEASRIRSNARTADRNSADGGDVTVGSSRPLISPNEDDESRPLYRPNVPGARPTKVSDAVAASTFLAAAGVFVPARLHQRPAIETLRMTGRSWEDCQCELQIRDAQTTRRTRKMTLQSQQLLPRFISFPLRCSQQRLQVSHLDFMFRVWHFASAGILLP